MNDILLQRSAEMNELRDKCTNLDFKDFWWEECIDNGIIIGYWGRFGQKDKQGAPLNLMVNPPVIITKKPSNQSKKLKFGPKN